MEQRTEIDIIILSYAQTEELKIVTENCISSLMISEDPEKIKFNIILIESEKSIAPFQYENTITVYPEVDFGYHRYMNIGIDMTNAPYICICNNDLIFYEGWATSMLTAFEMYKLSSGSPACGIFHPKAGYPLDGSVHFGYRVRAQVAGWCIFFRRDILERTGKLDENFKFWCADNDYASTLWALKLRHGLVTSSRVDHLESRTLNYQTKERQQMLTYDEIAYWEKKWKYRMGTGWILLD